MLKQVIATTAALALCAALSVPAFAVSEKSSLASTTPTVTAPNLAEGEQLYTVKRGDTLSQISVLFYGQSKYYPFLFLRNDTILSRPDRIYVGQVLVIPSMASLPVAVVHSFSPSDTKPATPITELAAVLPVAGEGETLYLIQAGDTLASLAQKYYGNSNLYMTIFERNKDILEAPDQIYVGQTIVLPAANTQADWIWILSSKNPT